MPERLKALVEPSLLVWARKSAALSEQGAADAIGVALDKVVAWEKGDDRPTIPQLKKLAIAYKRPLAVFYLPEPPKDFMPLRDFRRLPDSGTREYSPELAYEIRAAHERRLAALEIYELAGEAPPEFPVRTASKANVEALATRIRETLGIKLEQQFRWADANAALRAWREAIEDKGVLVSVLGGAHHSVALNEVRGFAIAEQQLPMIVVNGADRPNARIFTLLHELGHVVLGQSVIENEVVPGKETPAAQRAIEVFCNQLAGAVLMPRDALQNEAIVKARPGLRRDWSDEEIEVLANRYSVSREALLIRLATLGRAADDFVQKKRREYAKFYAEAAAAEKKARAESPGFAPPKYQLINYLGRGFARLVFEAYHERRLSLNTVSAYLGTQAKHVPTIEQVTYNLRGANA